MESVEGMMEKMKLSDAERKGVRVTSRSASGSRSGAPQAIRKVLADQPVNADGLAQALGRMWCLIGGIDCKDLGRNHFLFTFHQAAGKRKALEDGPWVFGKDLIIVVDFDGRKRLEDINFEFIPIWIWASGMPLGMMNKETGGGDRKRSRSVCGDGPGGGWHCGWQILSNQSKAQREETPNVRGISDDGG